MQKSGTKLTAIDRASQSKLLPWQRHNTNLKEHIFSSLKWSSHGDFHAIRTGSEVRKLHSSKSAYSPRAPQPVQGLWQWNIC